MKIKFVEEWKFKLTGRSVPVVHVSDVDPETGKVRTLRLLGTAKDRPNSIVDTYDVKGWEKKGGAINFIDAKGVQYIAYICGESGQTEDLFIKQRTFRAGDSKLFPNLEGIIGPAATMDDIGDSMDLGKSMRNLLIGMVIGIFIGWWIVGPMFGAILS